MLSGFDSISINPRYLQIQANFSRLHCTKQKSNSVQSNSVHGDSEANKQKSNPDTVTYTDQSYRQNDKMKI